MEQLGKSILFIGLVLVLIGGFVWLFGNKLSWFGNLPGDIRVEKEHFKFYAPIISMLLVSMAISAVIWLVRRFWS